MKNNIFGLPQYFDALSEKLEQQERFMKPFQMATKLLEDSGIARYANLTANIPIQQICAVGSALISNSYQFEDSLAQKLHELYDPLDKSLGTITAMENMLGRTFQERIQPTLYLPNICKPANITSVPSSLASSIDISWMQQANPWLTEISRVSALNISALSGLNTTFSKLLTVEQETSNIALIANRFSEITSVATQLTSIGKSLDGISAQWREMIAPLQLLSNYSDFALHQYSLVQKAASINDIRTIEWRLDLLEATSKFVDRQITWTSNFAADIQDEIDAEALLTFENDLCVSEIPQYIGYSKRDNKTVDNALAESAITIITEKGKLIVHKIQLIQKLCKTNNSTSIFENTNFCVQCHLIIAETFCRNPNSFKIVVEALFHLFCSKKNILNSIINLNSFECIQQIENLRDKRNIPDHPKKITSLQNSLYDQILLLEEDIIKQLELDSSSNLILYEEQWSGETISKNILKALLKIQNNKTFYGKKEDELNDYIRDILSMIYEIKDQTRQGTSPNGKDAGEIDLQICRNGFPIAMIEGLKVNCVNRKYIQSHIDKVLTYYDPLGCPYVYLIIYATVKKFADFWSSFLNFIQNEYSFPYTLKGDVREMQHMYSASRHAKALLLREDKEVTVHFYILQVQ